MARMTFDLLMVWSNLYPSCLGNTGRLLQSICKYAGERLVAHGPLISYLLVVLLASESWFDR